MRRGTPTARWAVLVSRWSSNDGSFYIPELVKVDRPGAVSVEHSALISVCPCEQARRTLPDHHAHSVWIERTPVAVHKRSPQLRFCQATTVISVHRPKQLPQRFAIVCISRRRRCRRRSLHLRNRRSPVVALRRWPLAIVCRWGAANAGPRVVARVIAVVVCAWRGARVVARWSATVAVFWAVGLLRTGDWRRGFVVVWPGRRCPWRP